MKTIGKKFCVLLVLATAGCSGKNEKSEVLVKANTIHLEAAKIHQRLEKRLDSARAISNDSVRIRSLDSLSTLLELWESTVVEVPGFEHAHSGEHHHHHPAPAMTDNSMLEYQQNAYTAIRELEESFNK